MQQVSFHPLEEPGRSAKKIDPCALVIFGATGDLTARKLAPALYNLGREGLLPANFAAVGFARRPKTDEIFREEFKTSVSQFSRVKPVEENFWKTFSENIFYHASEFDQDAGYLALANRLKELDAKKGLRGNRLFYLSVQPKYFPLIIEKLRKNGLIYDAGQTDRFSRVIIEKPFGHDTKSAEELQATISQHLHETQIYRIDHYLGKETVQNLLVFRFANSIFESLWNYKHIDHVQITVAESIGIGTRGHFFEEAGLLRDVIQNHVMQLFSLVAMEPPVNLSARAVRDEKVKVLQSIRPLSEADFREAAVRGQYAAGYVDGKEALGYRQEKDVAPNSSVETYVALRLFIDNWRWAGVPFYIRAGKRLPKRSTEIAITFKDAPGVLFQQNGHMHDPNVLAIRIQPNEGIAMKINCKVPGLSSPIQPVKMDFSYGTYFGGASIEAYERLIWDAILGDSTLFARSDEVAQSWQIFTPLLEFWAKDPAAPIASYPAGSWGPPEAENLFKNTHRAWRIL